MLFSFLIFSVLCYGQPTIEWAKSFGGTGWDEANSVIYTSEGEIIAAGQLDDGVSDNFGIYKLDSAGNLIWQKSYGGSGNERAKSVIQCTDGGYLVVGYTNSNNGDISSNNGSADFWIIKLNGQGELVWEKSYGSSKGDVANAVIQSADGGYVIAGYSDWNNYDVSSNNGSSDFWIIKLDGQGELIWEKSYGGTNIERANSIIQSIDGGYVVAGLSISSDGYVSNNNGSLDFWIIKLNSQGELIWEKSYGGIGSDEANAVVQTVDGGFVIAGRTSVEGNTRSLWVIKINSTGSLIWEKKHGCYRADEANDVKQTQDGGYILASNSSCPDLSTFNILITKLDSSGELIWEKSYGGTGYDVCNSIALTPDGGYVVAGLSSPLDFWVAKLAGTETTNTLTVSPQSKTINQHAGSTSFQITSNVAWTASTDANWVTLSPTNGTNNYYITANYPVNTSTSDRTATITITGGGLTQTITLTQQGNTILSVTPQSEIVNQLAGFTTFEITSNIAWTISENVDWFGLSKTSGTNDASVIAIYTQNQSTIERTATATLTGGGLTQEITITQLGVEKFSLIGFEAIQVIQNWENTVPLIANKPTLVRAHIKSNTGNSATFNATLKGYRGNSLLGELSPENSITALGSLEDVLGVRTTGSLNFRIPDSWLSGTIRFELVDGTGQGLSCGVYNNCSLEMSFEEVKPLQIKFFRVKWQDSDGNWFQASESDILDEVEKLKAIYPVDGIEYEIDEIEYSEFNNEPTNLEKQKVYLHGLNVKLAKKRLMELELTHYWKSSPIYYGILSDEIKGNNLMNYNGLAGFYKFSPFATYNEITIASSVQGKGHYNNVIAHEIGHCLNRDHTGVCGDVKPIGAEKFPYTYLFNDEDVVDDEGIYATIGPFEYGYKREIWGYNNNEDIVVNPNYYFELMSYCRKSTSIGWRWISDHTYLAIKDKINLIYNENFGNNQPSNLEDNYKLVSGTINFDNDYIELDPLIPFSSAGNLPDFSTGEYTLELVNNSNQVIEEIKFNPITSVDFHDGMKNDKELGYFMVPILADLDISQIRVKQNNTQLAALNKSSNAPSISIISPNNQQISGDLINVTWSGIDVDGDNLTYILEFSNDGGATWKVIDLDLQNTTYEVNLTNLELTNDMRFKVTVSDGFNTAYDITGVLTKDDLSCTGDNLEVLWDRTLGGEGNDNFEVVINTPDGGYLLGGQSTSNISGDKSENHSGKYDYWIVKINSKGQKEWDNTFGGSNQDYLRTMVNTTDNGYLLGGWSNSNASDDKSQNSKGGADYWIIKINAQGQKEWDKVIGGRSSDFLNCIIQTTDDGYLLGGASYSGIGMDKSESSRGDQDYWIVKINSEGQKEWDKTFGSSSLEGLLKICNSSDGGYILGGTSWSEAGGEKSGANIGVNDYWIIKINSQGQKIWDKTFGGTYYDGFNDLISTSDNGYLLGGYSRSDANGNKSEPNLGNDDYWVIKINSQGQKIWDKTFGGDKTDRLSSIIETSDGNYLLGGDIETAINVETGEYENSLRNKRKGDYWVIKINKQGQEIWNKAIGGNDRDFNGHMIQASEKEFIIAGSSESNIGADKSENSKGYFDYWIIKTKICDSCPETINISESVLSHKVYKAKYNIVSTSEISSSTNVDFYAGNNIALNAGFHAKAGANFIAEIKACSETDFQEETANSRTLGINNSMETIAPPIANLSKIELSTIPNPFSSSTIIEYTLPKSSNIHLALFSITGQKIQILSNNKLHAAGKHQLVFNRNQLEEGMYFLVLISEEERITRKVILVD